MVCASVNDSKLPPVPERLVLRLQQLEELTILLQNRLLLSEERNLELEELLYQQARHALLGEMVGTLGHHWRQPLNNISLLVQNLRIRLRGETDLTGYIDEVLDTIQQMSGTMSHLLGTFGGDQVKQTVPLPATIRESIELAKEFLKCKPISFELHIEETLSSFGSRNELMLALLHVITNFRDQLLAHRVEEPVILIQAAGEGGRGMIVIRDNCSSSRHPRNDTLAPRWHLCRMAIEKGMGGKCAVTGCAAGSEVRIEIPLGTPGTQVPAVTGKLG
jgi:signal transduction histidine kinase